MAYIRKRKDGWFAEIRRKGYSPLNKTLKTQVAAKAWARRVETSMDNGSYIDTRASGSVLIDQLIDALACPYIVIAAKCHRFPPFYTGSYLVHHLRSQSIKRPAPLQFTFVDFCL